MEYKPEPVWITRDDDSEYQLQIGRRLNKIILMERPFKIEENAIYPFHSGKTIVRVRFNFNIRHPAAVTRSRNRYYREVVGRI